MKFFKNLLSLNHNNAQSETFCKLPFMHVAQDIEGHYRPCCRFNMDTIEKLKTKDLSFGQAFNSYIWKKIRKKMKAGKKIEGCSQCYEEEKKGMKSYRLRANETFKDYESYKIGHIDISLSNVCNMQCNMCAPNKSSKWVAKLKKERPDLEIYKHSASALLKNTSIQHLKSIEFLGGEPFIQSELDELLDHLLLYSNTKNIEISIYTNSTKFPKEETLKKLQQFKLTEITLSIDGIKDTNEFIRKGPNWDQVEKTAYRWKEFVKNNSNFLLNVAPTIQKYNIVNLPELLNWIRTLEDVNICHTFINTPEYLKINHLNTTMKTEAIQKLQNFRAINNKEQLIVAEALKNIQFSQ